MPTPAEWQDPEYRARLSRYSNPSRHDPVHKDGDEWYWWDETWANRVGPYATEAEARYELDFYARLL